jgi:2-hydroxy-6-oxonona-2,4-dienedioate hydrolase
MAARVKFESLWIEIEFGFETLRIHSLCSQEQTNDGSPVIFVPGLAAPARSMIPTAQLLPPDRRIFAVDLPEHAGRQQSDEPLSLSQYAAITANWVEALRIERAVWVGHSFGAQVLVELAIERPNLVDRLVLVSPTVAPEARTVMSQAARLLLDATREPPALLRLLAREYLRTGGHRLLEIGRVAVADRVEEKLPLIEAPTLVVRGERDPLVPERWAKQIASLLPNAELVVIRGAPHAVQYACPEALAQELLAFLDEAAGGAPLAEVPRAEPTADPPV